MGAMRAMVALTFAAFASANAQTRADTAGLDAALQRYASLVRQMASDSIGTMYLPNGVLAAPDRPPIVGPGAVAAFLHGFDNYRVLKYEVRGDSVATHGDTAWQQGRWWQQVRLPNGDTVTVNGGLSAEWVRIGPATWHLRRLGTYPRDAGPWPLRAHAGSFSSVGAPQHKVNGYGPHE